jgi:hypothetical protein
MEESTDLHLWVSIKTKTMPAATFRATVRTFRDCERLGRKLAAFVKNAGKVLPDLRDAVVQSVTIETGVDKPLKARKKRSSGGSGGEVAGG